MLRFRDALTGLALTTLFLPAPGRAQEREVVSKEIAVGRAEAALRLEFADGARLALALREGSVLVDGEPVGSYTPGDAVEAAWRELLGEAVQLDDGPLAAMLRAWTPPSALEGAGLDVARRLDEALENALTVPATPEAPPAPRVTLSTGDGDEAALLRVILGQTSRLALLGRALEGLDEDTQLHLDEDVEVAAGETVVGNLVVIQGDARVEGTVRGDVVVVGGTLELLEGGLIEGDVKLADARLERDGTVEGEVVDLAAVGSDVEREVRDRLREELRSEIRRELRSATRETSRGFFSPFGRIFRGVGGLMENLVIILALGLVGTAVVSFAPRNLDVVAEAARHAPGRAAMVGLAGTFLLIPVWVLGAVALAVSIVGIPVMIAWIPLFPLAALAAAVLGYLAVARNLGEWLADSGYRYTDWIRKSNAVTTVVGGIAGLMAFFMAANVLGMIPFFGLFRGLLAVAGVMATVAAVMVGFGSVLLTRAGRRPEYRPADFDEAWRRAVEMDAELDVEATAGAPGAAEGERHA